MKKQTKKISTDTTENNDVEEVTGKSEKSSQNGSQDAGKGFCLRCGNEFSKKGKGHFKKKFCSTICRTRHNSGVYHKANCHKPEFKAKQRKNFKKWLGNNKEHFNDLVREPNKIRSRKIFLDRKEKGTCIYCDGKKDEGYISCSDCREKKREYVCRPHVRKKLIAYRENPDMRKKARAYHKKHYAKPEVKERVRLYNKEYNRKRKEKQNEN